MLLLSGTNPRAGAIAVNVDVLVKNGRVEIDGASSWTATVQVASHGMGPHAKSAAKLLPAPAQTGTETLSITRFTMEPIQKPSVPTPLQLADLTVQVL